VTDTTVRTAVLLTCGGCPSRWSGLARAHCSACHLTFTGVSAFDRHRSADDECLDPTTLGMVLRPGALWGAPALSPEEAAKIWKKEQTDA